ncbi:hypothetical protein JTB14_015826 [Gonioctena quinquepunctata]|nr:hypothetical protein JTB14_015826 [Gonioctena quinquepunctata]
MTRLEDDQEPFSLTSSGSIYQPQSNSDSEEEHSQYEEDNLRGDENDSFESKDAERAHTSILPDRPKRGRKRKYRTQNRFLHKKIHNVPGKLLLRKEKNYSVNFGPLDLFPQDVLY